MKKIILASAAVIILLVNVSYAETYETTASTSTEQKKTTTYQSTVTTPTEEKKTTVTVETEKQPLKNKNAENNGSVYDSIRSGWNKFIDVLAGPKK